MAGSEDDELAGWGELVEGKDAPVEGRDKETLRRAMRLNPALKAQLGTTSHVMNQLKKGAPPGSKPNPSDRTKEPARPVSQGNFAELVAQAKARYATDLKRLREQLAKAQADIAALKPQTLDSVISGLVSVDPNMVSPVTLAVVTREKAFLDDIGFSADKVVERHLRKR